MLRLVHLARHGLLVGSLGIIGLIGWSAVRVGMADHLHRSDPSAAIEWWPRHVLAWQALAAARIEVGEWEQAREHALAAVALRPLEPRAYRILGAAFEAEQRINEAIAAHRAAVSVAPNESRSHLWLAGRLLGQGAFPEAMGHVDRALKAQPGLAVDALDSLIAGIEIAGFRSALIKVLGQRPPWRRVFIERLAGSERPTPGIDLFLRELAGESPFEFDEIATWLARLEREQQWPSFVHHAKAQLETSNLSRAGEHLVDGSFAGPFRSQGLGWRMSRVGGALIALSRSGGGGKGTGALSVRFMGQRLRFEHVAQLVVLEPGSYRLTGEARTQDLRVRQGLRWSVRCFEDYRLLASSPPFLGSADWREWAVEVTVPPGCGAQWIRLEQIVDSPQDEWIGGVALFRGLSLKRTEAGQPPAAVN